MLRARKAMHLNKSHDLIRVLPENSFSDTDGKNGSWGVVSGSREVSEEATQ